MLRLEQMLDDSQGNRLQCDFGYTEASHVAERVLELGAKDFHKSMTTLEDSAVWQDVYRPLVEAIPA